MANTLDHSYAKFITRHYKYARNITHWKVRWPLAMLHSLHSVSNDLPGQFGKCRRRTWQNQWKVLLLIDTLSCQWKELEDKGKSMMHVLYVLWLANRHVSKLSSEEIKLDCHPFHCCMSYAAWLKALVIQLLEFHNLLERYLKTFWAWLCLTDTVKLL